MVCQRCPNLFKKEGSGVVCQRCPNLFSSSGNDSIDKPTLPILWKRRGVPHGVPAADKAANIPFGTFAAPAMLCRGTAEPP